MSRFDNAEHFELANDFTILHKDEEKKLSNGRPFMSTRVPQSIWLELTDIEFTHRVEWQDSRYGTPPPDAPNFKVRSVFTARGIMNDAITAFRVPGGKVARFREVDVMIKPIPKGQVGGEKRASTMDGISFSGMSSKVVPPEGLMAGEPGCLMFVDPSGDEWPSDRKDPYLQLEAYVDEAEFSMFMQRMSMAPAPIGKARVTMVAELFEYEVDASLAEPWHRKDYGMLLKADDTSYGVTRARVDTIEVLFRPSTNAAITETESDQPGRASVPMSNTPKAGPTLSNATLVRIERRLGVLTGIVAFAAAVIVGRLLFG